MDFVCSQAHQTIEIAPWLPRKPPGFLGGLGDHMIVEEKTGFSRNFVCSQADKRIEMDPGLLRKPQGFLGGPAAHKIVEKTLVFRGISLVPRPMRQ